MKTKSIEVVYNVCFGGFSISEKAVRLARKLDPKNKIWWDDCVLFGEKYSCGTLNDFNIDSYGRDIQRHNPILIKVIKELGKEANGECAELKIKKLIGTQYRIDEYDGSESVEQPTDTQHWISAK